MYKSMWKLLVIWINLGFTWGFHPGLEYQYEYTARLFSGIPDLRQQFAGAGIKTNVTLQLSEDNTLLIQLNNIEVGEFHLDFSNADGIDPQINYTALLMETEFLRKPFGVFKNASTGEPCFIVPKEEKSWISNIRKSIVNTIPLTTLWKINQEGQDILASTHFGHQETHMGGRCMTWFIVNRIPEFERIKISKNIAIDEDAQPEAESSYKSGNKGPRTSSSSSGATEIPAVSEDLWHIRETVNYDHCDHVVTAKINSNAHLDQLHSKSSIASHYLKGDSNGVRLEETTVEGSISVFTSESSSEYIRTFTDQTLSLRAVKLITQKLSIQYETHLLYTSQFETSGLGVQHSTDDAVPNLELALIGATLSDEEFAFLKRAIIVGLTKLSSAPNNIASEMQDIVEIINYLNYQQIQEIYEQLLGELNQVETDGSEETAIKSGKAVEYFKSVIILAGTDAAVNFILDKMKDENIRLKDANIFFLFNNLRKTLKNPALVPKILDLSMLMSWNEKEEMAKSLALTEGASLANKLCFNPERNNTYVMYFPYHTKFICDPDAVINKYIPYLEEGLKNTLAPMWQRVTYLQALVNLGVPQTLETLKPFIFGTEETNVGFRTIAISSLAYQNMPSLAVGLVYDLLMPIIENRGEYPEIRSMAFLVLTTWEPGLNWWQHMAAYTWEDSSSQVANLISSTIHTIAERNSEMSQIASKVVFLTNSYQPMSLVRSAGIFLRDYIDSDIVNPNCQIIWLANSEGLIPTHVIIWYEFTSLYGFSAAGERNMYQRGLDFFITLIKQYKEMYEGKQQTIKKARRNVFQMISSIIEELGVQITGFPTDSELFIKFEKNIEFAKKLEFFADGNIFGFIQEIAKSLPDNEANIEYGRDIDTIVSYPTDLGLPLIIQYLEHSAGEITTNDDDISVPNHFQDINIKTSLNFRIQASQETIIQTKVLVPWLKRRIASGVQHEVNISIPIIAHAGLIKESKQAVLTLESPVEKMELGRAQNLPYTAIYNSLEGLGSSVENSFAEIQKYDEKAFDWTSNFASWSGLGLEETWKGDTDMPAYLSLSSSLTPDSNWNYLLNYDKEKSTTKEITFKISYESSEIPPQMCSDSRKVSGDHNAHGPDYLESLEGIDEEMTSVLKRLKDNRPLQSPQNEEVSGAYTALRFNVELQGPTTYNYEVLAAMNKENTEEQTKTNLKINLNSNKGSDGGVNQLSNVCIDVSSERPNILPLTTTEDILTQDLKSTVHVMVDMGITPTITNVLEIWGGWEITEEMKDTLRNNEPLPMDLLTSQIYDQFAFIADWSDDFPRSWMNHTYDIYDTIRGKMFPKVEFNYMTKYFKNTAAFVARKNIPLEEWTAALVKPQEHSIYRHIYLNYPLLLSPASFSEYYIHNLFNGGRQPVCAISDSVTTTFDGAEISWTPDGCWNLVSVECESMLFLIQVRYTTDWEVRILLEDLRFDVTKSTLKVNEEEASTSDDRFQIHRLDHAVLLTLSNGMAVKVSDQVQILLNFDLRAKVCGLCGNFDGEISTEMKGPTGCFYGDPELYSASWTVQGEECDTPEFRELKEKVKNYQKTCSKETYVPTGISHELGHLTGQWEHTEEET